MRLALETSYEVALRAIGQDLATLFVDLLEITIEGDEFAIRGVRVGQSAKAGREGREKLWHRILSMGRRRSGVQHASIREPFVRKYSQREIQRLDENTKLHRSDTPKMQDVSTLADSLRALGRMVDSRRGRLIRLQKNREDFALEYEDVDGVVHKDAHSTFSLHRSQQAGVSLRDPKKEKDPWSGRSR